MTLTRRELLYSCACAAAGVAGLSRAAEDQPKREKEDDALRGKALIAITLDLEMSRNFPSWEQTHWDYEKGNLDDDTKRYTVEACRRVKERGHMLHCFAVGRVLEQENVDWLKGLVAAGHPVGNHTYDHVNVKAVKPEDIQFRFRRAPWLIREQSPRQVIRENIRMTTLALKERCGIEVDGFRTPGGFPDGLADREDVQKMLLELGFTWASSKYPRHAIGKPGEEPPAEILDDIVKAQSQAQPFVYKSGLVEIPMSPISDISAFRGGRWKLEAFLKATRRAVAWAIEQRAVFDFLGHPSCLLVTDPKFRTIDLICDLVEQAKGRAAIVGLSAIARQVRTAAKP